MSGYPYVREPLFNVGEGVVSSDFNDITRFLRAQMYDLSLNDEARYLAANPIHNYAPADTLCWVKGDAGYPLANGSVRTVTNKKGLIYINNGASMDGSEATTLAYFLEDDELLTAFDVNADASKYRIDMVCLKLSYEDNNASALVARDFEDAVTRVKTSPSQYKYRRTSIDVVVVKGTGAAFGTSPVEASPPSGYVKWCSVLVPPASFASAFSNSIHIRDFRVPMGKSFTSIVTPKMIFADSTNFVIGTGSGALANVTGSGTCFAILPGPILNSGRITKITALANFSGAGQTMQPFKYKFDDDTNAGNYNSITMGSGLVVTSAFASEDLVTAPPLWGNGHAAGPANASANTILALQFPNMVNLDKIYNVIFQGIGA